MADLKFTGVMIGVVFVRRLRDHDFQSAPHPVADAAKGYPWVTPAR